MKKVYMTPELEEVKIGNMNLLTGSGAITTDGIVTGGYGGVDDGTHEPGIPEILPPNLFDGFEGI